MALSDIFRELAAAKVDGIIDRYAVGGAVGATFYIEPSATEDVDVFVVFRNAPSPLLTLGPVFAYLAARGAMVNGEQLVIAGWPVQLLPATSPLVEEALHEAAMVDVEGQEVPVFRQEHLAAIALETGRPKDKTRLLQFLESKTFDTARFDALVARHHLGDKWSRFEAQFMEDGP